MLLRWLNKQRFDASRPASGRLPAMSSLWKPGQHTAGNGSGKFIGANEVEQLVNISSLNARLIKTLV